MKWKADDWPNTRKFHILIRLCTVWDRAFGYDHGPLVRAWMRRVLEKRQRPADDA